MRGAIRGGVRWFLRSGLRWAILALVIVAFLWFIPQLQGAYFSQQVPAKERPALVNEYRRTWAQIIGGFGLLLGLYFTWRRIEISQQELEATRDQQVTERFTRAIDQLGATDNVKARTRSWRYVSVASMLSNGSLGTLQRGTTARLCKSL